ncbi:MAG: alpha/beta hydrolase, partial [Ignavibacteria bacterium]|jgi:pimeloyl-ACP methyl ester carboxylesterase|nr:alpha/beta hydrolase [Ignavibacteria bacterium]
MWEHQIKHFGNDYRVIAYDVRGLGRSFSDDNLFFMENYADDLENIITALKLENVNAVGLSMGGYIIQRTIVKNPSLFGTITLADTKGEKDTDEALLSRSEVVDTIRKGGRKGFVSGFIKKLISDNNYKNSEIVKTLEKIISENSDKGICGVVNALATRTTTLHQLRSIEIPALILVGEEDTVTPLKCSEDLAAAINNSEMHIIKNSGHLSSLENPVEFNSLLEIFLEEHNKR